MTTPTSVSIDASLISVGESRRIHNDPLCPLDWTVSLMAHGVSTRLGVSQEAASVIRKALEGGEPRLKVTLEVVHEDASDSEGQALTDEQLLATVGDEALPPRCGWNGLELVDGRGEPFMGKGAADKVDWAWRVFGAFIPRNQWTEMVHELLQSRGAVAAWDDACERINQALDVAGTRTPACTRAIARRVQDLLTDLDEVLGAKEGESLLDAARRVSSSTCSTGRIVDAIAPTVDEAADLAEGSLQRCLRPDSRQMLNAIVRALNENRNEVHRQGQVLARLREAVGCSSHSLDDVVEATVILRSVGDMHHDLYEAVNGLAQVELLSLPAGTQILDVVYAARDFIAESKALKAKHAEETKKLIGQSIADRDRLVRELKTMTSAFESEAERADQLEDQVDLARQRLGAESTDPTVGIAGEDETLIEVIERIQVLLRGRPGQTLIDSALAYSTKEQRVPRGYSIYPDDTRKGTVWVYHRDSNIEWPYNPRLPSPDDWWADHKEAFEYAQWLSSKATP